MELASGHGVRDVAGGGEIIVMGDEQQGRGMLAHCVPQHRKHLAAGLGVECSGRLVADEKLGLVDQGAGDRNPLLFAARESLRQFPRLVPETDRSERGKAPAPAGRGGSARGAGAAGMLAVPQCQLDVFERR